MLSEMIQQGVPLEQTQVEAYKRAMQMQQEQQGAVEGQTQLMAPNEPQLPQGTTDAVAMANMAQGM